MNSRKSQTFVGRPAEPGVYYILIKIALISFEVRFLLCYLSASLRNAYQ